MKQPPSRRLSTERVIEYVRTLRGRPFTTDELARRFRVRRGQAAAAVAVLRMKHVVEPALPRARYETSHWFFTG